MSTASRAHLKAALKAYKQALELDKDNLVIHLGLAWLTEQAGRKDDAVKQYRTIATDAWEKEKSLTMVGFGGRTLTGEVASYLVPLLDAEKDKREIETLKDRVATLGKLPYPVTPIAVPLADGLTTTDLEAPDARVTFDVDGSGLGREWSWITPKAAWLVSDPKLDGKINSGRQLFGNVTFWMFWNNGYAPLAALDDDRDGILTGKELAGLALWRDANGNGVAELRRGQAAFGLWNCRYIVQMADAEQPPGQGRFQPERRGVPGRKDAPHLRPSVEGAAWLPSHVSCAKCIGEQPLNCLKDGLWSTSTHTVC